MKISYHLIIKGKVQGVCYRDSMCQKAQEFNVVGWVRNLSDRTVEAKIEGRQEDINKLIEYCYQGPIAANVIEINKEVMELEGFSEFKVLY